MNIPSIGTDISDRMVHFAQENISYLSKHFSVEDSLKPEIFERDATASEIPSYLKNKKLTIITEPFLGLPQSRALSPTEVQDFYNSVMPLYRKFFMNIKNVLQKNDRLLVLFPCPRGQKNGEEFFFPLPRPFLDEIAGFGYRKPQLIPKEISDLRSYDIEEAVIYARPDAFVARELILWERD